MRVYSPRGYFVLLCAFACAWLVSSNVHVSSPSHTHAGEGLLEYLKCQICEVPRLEGMIDDCCCDAETVARVNSDHFLPTLHELTKRTYFRYFKVDLWRQCPFWEEDGMCAIRDCAVCECDPDEIPSCWMGEDTQPQAQTQGITHGKAGGVGATGGGAAAGESPIVQAIGAAFGTENSDADPRTSNLSRVEFSREGDQSNGFVPWRADDDPNIWTVQDNDSLDLKYVNLLRNPEGFTGYAGPSAGRIWQAIYSENCFTGPLEGMCYEERVMYRLISGLQTSINSHIAMTYGDGTGSRHDLYSDVPRLPSKPSSNGDKPEMRELVLTSGLQPNLEMYVQRIAKYPERLENLYFAFLFLVRAVAKARPLLASLNYNTGNVTEDAATRNAVLHLLDVQAPAVLAGFDESLMFRDAPAADSAPSSCASDAARGVNSTDIDELATRHEGESAAKQALRTALRDKFRNISRIMDCVGCEKCRLWGKLQFLGMGTAMKILFAEGKAASSPLAPMSASLTDNGSAGNIGNIHLSRNELVALINVLHRVSMSIAAIDVMRDMEASRKVGNFMEWTGVSLLIGVIPLLTFAFICRRLSRKATAAAVDADRKMQ